MNVNTLIRAVKKLESISLTRKLTSKESKQLEIFAGEAYDSLLYAPFNKEMYGVSKTVGKHKLPRFMYHLTTEEAYKAMQKSGKIIPQQCCDAPSGIFLFDMKNFCQFWRKGKNIAEQPRTTLLNMIANKIGATGNIVLLKIPTSTIDARSLRLRVQTRCRMGSYNNISIPADNSRMPMTDALEGLKYIMQGESIANLPRYNQLKKAVEYITPNEIDMQNVQLVGRTQVKTEEIDKAAKDMKDLPNVWLDLTKDKQERHHFERMV